MPRSHIAKDCSTQSKLASTADYHSSLLEQSRHQLLHDPDHSYVEYQKQQQCQPHAHGNSGSRHWLSSSHTYKKSDTESLEHDNVTGPMKGIGLGKKKHGGNGVQLSHCDDISRRELEEFEALPTAIRRKYFSTLERLRFAQTSGTLQQSVEDSEGPSSRNRNPRDGHNIIGPLYHHTNSAFLSPSKLRHDHLTREEQVVLARQLRASVILDAADEAIYKVGRRASKNMSPPAYTPTSAAHIMEQQRDTQATSWTTDSALRSLATKVANGSKRDTLYDCFRWLDEEEDLDLTLTTLDDYNPTVREDDDSRPTTKERRPSFRRHLSISKIPFGRSSVSSSRPATKDATSSVPSTPNLSSHQHARRRSRALSLITPKHMAQESTATSIDPAATHYQDPEARLKLRVYLASPQKFDEIIEFGFPSHEAILPSTMPESNPLRARHSERMVHDDLENMKTFLADDNSSTYSEDVSMADPDSPRTPQTLDKYAIKPHHLPTDDTHYAHKGPESYAHAPAHSREMTLRMTLTRPDLRACDDQIYGWQKVPYQPTTKLSQSSPLRDDIPNQGTYMGDAKHKENLDKFFASLDEESHTHPDGSVMKRIWNRVRRG